MNLPGSAPDSPANAHRWYAEKVQPHQPALKVWLRRRFTWISDVDDIVQEAVLNLWKRHHRSDLPPIRSPKGTLFAIARNAVIDRARHDAVARIDAVAEVETLPAIAEGSDVVQSVQARQELEILSDAIRQLPDRCRQVVTLMKVYGLSERETCERLSMAESTVRTHVQRGLERIDLYLAQRGVWRGRR